MKKKSLTLWIALGAIAVLFLGGVCLAAGGIFVWRYYAQSAQSEGIPPTSEPAPTQALQQEDVPTVLPTSTDRIPFTHPDGFFALELPTGWSIETSDELTTMCADPNGDVCVAVRIWIKSYSYHQMKDDFSVAMQSSRDNYVEITVEENYIGGLPGMLVEHSFDWGGVPQHGFNAFTVRNRIGIEWMAWSPAEDYPANAPIFTEITASLHILDPPAAPLYEAWSQVQTEHLTLYYLDDTWMAPVIDGIATDHDWAFAQIEAALGVNHNGIITIYLYPSEDALFGSTARRYGFAINEAGEVHSLWESSENHQSLGHEMTHVISYWTLGDPSEALLGEGLAVCLDQSGKDYRQVGFQMYQAGEWLLMEELMGDRWFAGPPEIAYPQSGSFVCYLLANYPLDQVKVLYVHPDFETGLNQVLQVSLQEAEADWIAWLSGND